MLAAEAPDVAIEAPSEPAEPVVEPAEAVPSEPAPAPAEAPEPEPPPPPPAEEAVTLGATETADPAESAEPDPAEEVATEPPAYISDEASPSLPHEDDADDLDQGDADAGAPPLVLPVNLNVDIRILSPGNDGDVSQVIDLGDLPGLGSGNPSDALGDLGLGGLDLGLDWAWNWNWTWDCGDASVAGLDWNWTWTWSGDCAAGILDESRDGYRPGQGSLRDRFPEMLDALSRDALDALPETSDESGPIVSAPGAGGNTPARPHERDDERGAPASAAPPDGGSWTPSGAPTIFASTGATSQASSATAPANSPAGAVPNGDPERQPAGYPMLTMGMAAAAGSGGGGGGAFSVLLLAALVGALALLPPPPGGRVSMIGQRLSSLLSSSRLERPG
jgi:hypothetical protein